MTRTHAKQRGNSKSGMVKVRVRNVPSTQRANNPTQPHVTHVESVKSLTEAVLNVTNVMQERLALEQMASVNNAKQVSIAKVKK